MGAEEAAHEQAIDKTVSLSPFSGRARLAAPPLVSFDDHPALPLYRGEASRRPERFLASAQIFGGGSLSANPADAVGIQSDGGVSGRLDGQRSGQLRGRCRHWTGQDPGDRTGEGVGMQGLGQRFVSPEGESRPQQQATSHLAP